MIFAVSTFWQAFINLIGWMTLVLVWVLSLELAAKPGSHLNADR